MVTRATEGERILRRAGCDGPLMGSAGAEGGMASGVRSLARLSGARPVTSSGEGLAQNSKRYIHNSLPIIIELRL